MRTNILAAAAALGDEDLLAPIHALARTEREATAELVAHLAALELRPNLYLARGYGSLFAYCTESLHLSEDAACNRIEAARASARFPLVLEMLAAGSLTLTSVRKLATHLTSGNHQAVLAKASHRTKEQIEALITGLAPKPDVPASVRKLPVVKTATAAPGTALPANLPLLERPVEPAVAGVGGAVGAGLPKAMPPPVPRIPRPIIQALAPQRYRVQFTIGQDTHDRLRRVQALLRRQIPDGDPATIFDRALRLLEEAEGKKRGLVTWTRPFAADRSGNYANRIRSGTDKARRVATDGPPGPSRHIPAAVKRAVWCRDTGQCAFVSPAGNRCTQRSFLELHHIQPYAMQGPATVGNMSPRCRRHNQYEAERVFGSRARFLDTSEETAT